MTCVCVCVVVSSNPQELLRDPTSKLPKEELKHLVIDYTQFDGWSSDEEGLDATAGIEAGYEHWQDREDEDEDDEEEREAEEQDDAEAEAGES